MDIPFLSTTHKSVYPGYIERDAFGGGGSAKDFEALASMKRWLAIADVAQNMRDHVCLSALSYILHSIALSRRLGASLHTHFVFLLTLCSLNV